MDQASAQFADLDDSEVIAQRERVNAAIASLTEQHRQLNLEMTPEGDTSMDDDTDFSTMDDPAFLAERKRVRETIEALTERYRRLNAEFDRRASLAWSEAIK